MKNLLLATIVLCSSLASAQTNPALTGGTTISNISTDLFESTMRPGINLGISFVGYYNEKFQTISEFYYETKGANTEGRQAAYGTDLEATYEPVNFKLGSGSWALIANYYFLKENLGVQFGPHLRLLNFGSHGGDVRYLGEGTVTQDMISDADVIEGMRELDYGLSFGLSAGFTDFMLSARYNLGLRKFKATSFNGSTEATFNNTSFSVSLTYIMRQFEIKF